MTESATSPPAASGDVTVDILPGHGAKLTVQGWEFTRVAMVRGVTGEGHTKLINAVLAVIEEVGGIYAEHPNMANTLIKSFDPVPKTPEEVEVRIIYAQRSRVVTEESQIEVGSSITQVETNKDSAGNLITLSYAYPVNYKGNDKYRGQTITQGGMIKRPVPTSTLSITRRESVSPLTKSQAYVGRVNSDVWKGGEIRTWLCTGITGRSDDSGDSYVVTYSFEYKFDTWDETIMFINPDDGKPPTDLVNNVGIKTIQGLTAVAFSGLGL